MLDIILSNQFKKDLKLAQKRSCDMNRLRKVVNTLAQNRPLPAKYKDHKLAGAYHSFRECHIEPDWLLIYRIDDNALALFLFRTGSHSDLF